MADFILRGVDDGLWKQFKRRAASDGRSLKWIITTLVVYYAKHGLPTHQPPPRAD
jgi:hypothetical protein